MKYRNSVLGLMLLLSILLTACGRSVTPDTMIEKPEEAMMENKLDETMADPTHDEMMDESTKDTEMLHNASTPDPLSDPTEESTIESPAWFSAALTDARAGQTFSINDFREKVILVETMAIWCSNCLRQQEQVKALHEQLGARDDLVSIGLDIAPNENTGALKSYVENKGFDWFYAVPSKDVSREIASLYGDQSLNPPSTPIVVIDRHGEAHPLPFDIKSADDLMQAI